jgi:hypothetical protein
VSTLADLLREVLRSGNENGVKYVRNTHVPEETFARLAYLTHDHAFDVGKEGSSADERLYEGGICRGGGTKWACQSRKRHGYTAFAAT